MTRSRLLPRLWPRGRAADIAVALVAALCTLVMSALAEGPEDRALWPGGAALILVATLALGFRRRHPIAVLLLTGAISPLYYPLGFPDGPVAFVFLVALFNAAVERRLMVSLGAVVAINAGFVAVGLLRGGEGTAGASRVVDSEAVASLSALLVCTVTLGQFVRNRHDRVEAAERRAAEAEQSREEEARRRATEERLRIARELHDVLAHQISLINVQAGAALHRRDDPERAYASLEAIKAASKETLRELRGVLGVLRQVDDGLPVAPAPSLARLGELLEQTTAAGLEVRRAGDLAATEETGEAGEAGATGGNAAAGEPAAVLALPAPVDLAGYRIVQEALTNIVRHAAAATATVEIRRTADAVIVQIDDDGAGLADASVLDRGNGMRGMRERAAAVGGELIAGRGPAGGFRVWARLPLGEPAEQMEEIA